MTRFPADRAVTNWAVHLLASLLAVGLVAVLAPAAAVARPDDPSTDAPATDARATVALDEPVPSGLALLGAAMVAARVVPHDARVVVVAIGEGGQPSLREHRVESRPRNVHVLAELDVERLADTHRVRGSGRVTLRTGPARVVRVARGGDVDRERLFVDERTGLLVRREVFDGDGTPVRVVAYTTLTVVGQGERTRSDREVGLRLDRPLDHGRLEILHATGWHVPPRLAAFTLVDGYAADQGPDGSVLHLRYDDGLYALSVYEQVGPLDRSALADAVALEVAGGTAWHWPGASPQRFVLSGDGLTFTVVSEAPMDVVAPALAELPNDRRPGPAQRMTHGAKRVAGWAWPFD